MDKELMHITDSIAITDREADKALTILGELLQDYSLMGDEPTKEEADKYAWEAKRIFHFIYISFDYVYDIKNKISKAYNDLTNIYNTDKKENETPKDEDKEYREQINAILDNLDETGLLKVYMYLNLMPQEVKA